MEVVNNLGKEFFKLLKKMSPVVTRYIRYLIRIVLN